jgi:hypothetical protein
VKPTLNLGDFRGVQAMVLLDDARHSGRNTWHDGGPWPFELVTLAIVLGSLGFWALILLVSWAFLAV